ncbi:MAG: hypothetical protein ACYCXH_11570, partial [Bellilinea sp.]
MTAPVNATAPQIKPNGGFWPIIHNPSVRKIARLARGSRTTIGSGFGFSAGKLRIASRVYAAATISPIPVKNQARLGTRTRLTSGSFARFSAKGQSEPREIMAASKIMTNQNPA